MEYVRQYSIDIISFIESTNKEEDEIAKALEDMGFVILGCQWEATWTKEGYDKCDAPISSD